MTEYVIANSKELYDVKTASLKDLNFTSQKNLFKIQQHGTWSMTLNYSYVYDPDWEVYYYQWAGQTSISHNLGFAPTFEVWGKFTSWGRNTFTKWTYYRYIHWSGPKFRIVISDNSDINIEYFLQIREDLYESSPPAQNAIVDGIYSIYIDPIL